MVSTIKIVYNTLATIRFYLFDYYTIRNERKITWSLLSNRQRIVVVVANDDEQAIMINADIPLLFQGSPVSRLNTVILIHVRNIYWLEDEQPD